MKRDLSVIGPLNVDLLINGDGPENWEQITTWDGPAQMEMTAAGSVGYTVRDLARLGLSVRVVSCVPDDALGAFIVETLRREGVDTSGVVRVADTLAGIGVYMLLFGDRKRPLAYRMPTHQPWPERFDDADLDEILEARGLMCGGYLHFKSMWHAQTVELFREARRRGLLTILDPQFPLFSMERPWVEAMDDLLPWIDLLFCDEYEARRTTASPDLEQAARRLLDHGPQTVVIKQGAQGSTVYRPGWQHHQQAVRLGELVDSIGAGDAYDSAFVCGWLQGWPAERCSLFASVAAGKTVTGIGGSATMPDFEQVQQIIREKGLDTKEVPRS
jgi:sugar/nucleoside kinase (ribokinase family)